MARVSVLHGRDPLPGHGGGEEQGPLVVVLESIGVCHTVIHTEVCGQGDLLGLSHLVNAPGSGPTTAWGPFLALTR